jgi:hypothetical protein
VGGDLELIMQLVAAGFPVMIEKLLFRTTFWPNDDLWAAHLVTGYDDSTRPSPAG